MSKYIKFTPELIDKMRQEFDAALSSAKMVGGEFTFKKTLANVDAKATLRFTDHAFLKMFTLVQSFDKEIAWHCVAERTENENEYLISDVLVYPQTVTGVTVEMDTAEYAKWIENGVLAGDERFFKLHAQGHSHVNMSTSPSGTDLQHQRGILEDLRPNGFYIFMIWNKRGEYTLWIYDLEKNIVFENKDITLEIGESSDEFSAFLKEAKEIVKAKVTQYTGAAGYSTGVGGYTKTPAIIPASGYNNSPKSAPETKPAVVTVTPKQKEKVRAVVASAPVGGYGYDDDEDDPDSPFYYRDDFFRR